MNAILKHAAGVIGRGKIQVAFGAIGSGAASTNGVSVPYPSGITAGMGLFLIVRAKDATTAAITTPSGWALIDSAAVSTAFLDAVYFKVATGSESGSLAVVSTSSVYTEGIMWRTSNIVSATEAATHANAASSSTVAAVLNVTTTSVLELAVQTQIAEGASTTLADITGETGTDYAKATAVYAGTNILIGIQVGTVAAATAISGGSSAWGAARANRATIAYAIKP